MHLISSFNCTFEDLLLNNNKKMNFRIQVNLNKVEEKCIVHYSRAAITMKPAAHVFVLEKRKCKGLRRFVLHSIVLIFTKEKACN